MKKHFILLLTVVAFSGMGYSQTNAAAARTERTEIYTSLKPKDAQPAVFSSQEELNARVQDKKNGIMAMIKANSNDPVKVKQLREELWRFENAIVQSSK